MKYRKIEAGEWRNWGILDIESEVKEMHGMNDVWVKIAQFLGTLNGENVKRESYVRTPEFEAALEAWKEKEQEWEDFLETLSAGQREKLEEIKECQEESPYLTSSCSDKNCMV